MFCHSTNTASFFSVLIAALIFSLSLARVAAAQGNTSLGTRTLQSNTIRYRGRLLEPSRRAVHESTRDSAPPNHELHEFHETRLRVIRAIRGCSFRSLWH